MKQFTIATILILLGVLAWLLGTRLSSDALGMAVGVVFGVLAGIPSALLVLASSRLQRQDDYDDDDDYHYGPRRRLPYQPPYQPPVVVVALPQQQAPTCYSTPVPFEHADWRPPSGAVVRRDWQQDGRPYPFRIVGEKVEPDDETGESYPVVMHGSRED